MSSSNDSAGEISRLLPTDQKINLRVFCDLSKPLMTEHVPNRDNGTIETNLKRPQMGFRGLPNRLQRIKPGTTTVVFHRMTGKVREIGKSFKRTP
jgi:hypothetical protein